MILLSFNDDNNDNEMEKQIKIRRKEIQLKCWWRIAGAKILIVMSFSSRMWQLLFYNCLSCSNDDNDLKIVIYFQLILHNSKKTKFITTPLKIYHSIPLFDPLIITDWNLYPQKGSFRSYDGHFIYTFTPRIDKKYWVRLIDSVHKIGKQRSSYRTLFMDLGVKFLTVFFYIWVNEVLMLM